MPTIVKELNNPSFVFFPMNNDRTAWRPYGAPAILVIPHRRDLNDEYIPNSQVFNVRVAIENVPRFAFVAGHDHIGLKYPDKELYGINLDNLALSDKRIDVKNALFYRNGVELTYADAITGDLMDYTTASGIHDSITYIKGADYFDLSDVLIEVETLPSSTYDLAYSGNYYSRVVGGVYGEQFICIDVDSIALALSRSRFQHPGKVMDEFYRHTPAPYLTNAMKSSDTTVGLYRPFTDIIQDVMDEQDILERVNWVYDCPAETIPYLSALLGWDIPYFPQSIDSLRRAVLRRTVELQRTKGSRRAILNIFRIFGYNILITNLWWSRDGKRFIRPDEKLPEPYRDQQITSSIVYSFNPLINGIVLNKFDTIVVPLIFRPQVKVSIDDFDTFNDDGSVTIDAYAVTKGSDADLVLRSITSEASASLEEYGAGLDVIIDGEGFLNATKVHERLAGHPLIGYSQILISGRLGLSTDQVLVGNHPPFVKSGVYLNRETNDVHLIPNGLFSASDNVVIYAFATYGRAAFKIPSELNNLQSNRFAIQVLTPDLTEYADPITLDFALEFVYKIKAFHSLLYLVRTRLEASENYEVTDLSVGGDYDTRYDTDIGRLQVPPAIIPNVPATVLDCAVSTSSTLGYKIDDIRLRELKLRLLIEDYEAWKSLDDRTATPSELLRLFTPEPKQGNTQAVYNYRGQDRITTQERVESRTSEFYPSPNTTQHTDRPLKNAVDNLIPKNGLFDGTSPNTSINIDGSGYGRFNREFTQPRNSHVSLDGKSDYKYKGRVDDEVLHQSRLSNSEVFRPRGCGFNLGVGVYYSFPSHSQINNTGVAKPARSSLTPAMTFTGGAKTFNTAYYREGRQLPYLSADPSAPLAHKYQSYLGTLYRSYDSPVGETIHYSNRIGELFVNQQQQLALIRPSLDISKVHLHLPGCRFPGLLALEENYINTSFGARPWDDEFARPCGAPGSCGFNPPSYLNYKIVAIDGENQQLTFDSAAYKVTGNGLLPDITNLGDHSLLTNSSFSEEAVIHKVYMKDAGSNPAVSFEQICDYDTSVIDGSILTDAPLFNSHSQKVDSGGDYSDYADGYPCVSGIQSYQGADLDRNGLYYDVMTGLGLTIASTNMSDTYLFTLGSGIRIEKGHRLDCGCSIFGLESNAESSCSTDIYKDLDGNHDWNNDHLRISPYLLQNESLGVTSLRLDGQIGTLLETI